MRSPADVEDVFSLAPIQEGTLFQALFEPESPLCDEQVHFVLDGPLDIEALCAAWIHLLDAHPILRSVIRWEGLLEPVRVVPVPSPTPVRVVDLRHLSAEEQESHVARDAGDRRAERRALDRGPLVRLTLFVVGVERFRLVWSFHRILLDRWSVSNLLRELARTYEAFAERAPLLTTPVRPYSDFVTWLREQDRSAALAFWRRQLAGFESATPLPRDRSTPVTRRCETDRVDVTVPQDVKAALERWTSGECITMSALLRAAWAILLARMSGTADVVFGATVSGRPSDIDGVEQMVGAFVNVVPVRVVVDGVQAAAAIVRRVHAESLDASAFEYLPLPELQTASSIPADRPLFDSVLVHEAHEMEPIDARPRSMGRVRIHDVDACEATRYDLTLCAGTADTLQLRLSYATDVFERETARRVVDALATLLGAIAADPQTCASDLPFVSAGDAALVAAWGDGGPGVAATGRSVAADVAAVAARTPEAVAIVAGGERWTYARLNTAAGRVAAALRASRVGRESRVGIIGTRSPGMIATVLGVIDAGAAFVPVESSQPDGRLRAIVQAADVAAVVTDRAAFRHAQRLVAELTPAPVVLCWDDLVVASANAVAADVAPLTGGPSDLAYIFFTSGSTGAPKGVMLEQRAMRNHLRAKIATLELDVTSVVAQNASSGFDIVVWQWLAPLLAGGRVVIYDRATAGDPAALLAALATDAVTVVETVPSFLEALLEVAEGPRSPSLPALRWMVSNAEALPAATVARWQARYPGMRLLNTYGATECSDDTTHGEVVASHAPAARVAVGRPIAGSTAAVVDERLRPVPPGCVGEIVLGGIVVGRGYLGDPVMTARAFVPDPFSAEPGARLYRTGDRGRWRADGVLECLGRQDDQVKVHGYRVELGEVEAALATLPAFSQVAAAVRTDARGQRRLVAYYVAPAPCDVAVVRKALMGKLPAYMVPDAIVRLEALPRTRTDKLDRAALPAPPAIEAATKSGGSLTPIEATVAAVWQHVLQVPRVGRSDSFFDLGGHPLTAMRIVAALEAQLGRHVPIRQLFLTPTLAEFAAAIKRTAA